MTEWFKKIARKVAAEVHKSKIEEFEKRIADMEKKHEVLLKSMQDNQDTLKVIDKRVYDANMASSKAIGAIEYVIHKQSESNNLKIEQNGK